MPIYEYKCSQCGQVFEVMEKFSAPPLTRHETCGGLVERLLSAPALQFKGTGWYITDYARSGAKDGKNGKSKESKAEAADSGSKSSGKTESKTSASESPAKTT